METNRTCCCCLSRPPHRDMKTPYSRRLSTGSGNTETYSDMLADCFGIHVILGNHECGICKVCVRRLQDARDFKLQVQRSQEELQTQLHSEIHFKDEEPEIKWEISEDDNIDNLKDMLMLDEEPDIELEISEDASLKDMLLLNKEAMGLSQRESPVSAVSSLCEEHLRQTYSVKFEEFSDDEALHQTPQEIFSNRASLTTQADQTHNSLRNPPNNNFKLRKQKKRRNTRQVQSKKENDMIYSLRSKITFKGKRPLNNFRDNNSTGPYTCEICQKVIATKRSMTCHMQNHQEPTYEIREDNIWDCDICEKIFATKRTLKTHIIIKHSNKTFRCDICSKRFARICYLNAHKRGHNERQMNYYCEICGRRFVNKFHLSRHIQDHSEKKQYTCDICKKQCRNKSTLRGHINAHMGVKPYSCKCGKTYTLWASYRKHELYQHIKPRPERERAFVCEICNKQFRENHNLKKHKLVHTGERPHACETCGKRFGAKSNLNTHRLTHVKDKTYSCELCPKKYLTKEGLRQHKRIHTGKKSMKTKRKNKKE